MLSLILLTQLAAAVPVAPPLITPVDVPAPVALPVAERPRGTAISDPSGSLLGIVDASDATKVIVAVGAYKVQVPANALQKISGRVSASITRQQVEATMAASAAFQQQSHVVPKAVLPPKGFAPLKAPAALDTSASLAATP